MISLRRASRPVHGPLLLAATLAAVPFVSTGQDASAPPGSEGPLSNDCFLPADPEARTGLEKGDAALVAARAARRSSEATRLSTEAFEAWRDALVSGGARGSVWVEPREVVERRRTVGLRAAVDARLAALDAELLDAWRARFEDAARAELLAAFDDDGLRAVEALYPATAPAVRAALRLADGAYERGRRSVARAWLERAAGNLALLSADTTRAALGRALATRRERLAPAPADDAGPRFDRAAALEPLSGLLLGDAGRDGLRLPPPGGGVHPGLCVLEQRPDGSAELAIQDAEEVHFVRLSATGTLTKERVFAPAQLLPGYRLSVDPRAVTRPPGWRLVPVAAEGDLYLVQGRTSHVDDVNAVLALRPQSTAGLSLLGDSGTPVLRWALVGAEHVDADGRVTELVELAGETEAEGPALAALEYQPGPVLLGDVLCVQAREYSSEVRAWLFGLDRTTGRLLWRTLLASGSDLVATQRGAANVRLAGEPLLALGNHVFASTGLGAGVLVDALDGTPEWSFRSRRRRIDAAGWRDARPIAAGSEPRGAGTAILWAPFDSDHLYALAGPGLAARGLAAHELSRARPLGESRTLLGGTPEALVVQGRAGSDATVSERGLPGTDRRDALYLGPDEAFAGRGLASENRVLCCTDRGVYLFDRARELYLLDYAALPPIESPSTGGALYDLGRFVIALGRDAAWSFAVEAR